MQKILQKLEKVPYFGEKFEARGNGVRKVCSALLCFYGTCFLILGFAIFLPQYFGLLANVHDYMFIDNTSDDTFHGPFGSMTSERKQFQSWSKPMKQAFQDCVKEKDNAEEAEVCLNGVDVTVAVFNVTNAADILKGDKPHVDELRPLSFKMYTDKKDIDTNLWDTTGVAKFRQDTTFELDPARCDKECQDLLEQKVIVPNPAWATVSAAGAEFAVAAMVAVSVLESEKQDPALVFGLGKEEVAPFMQVFVWEPKLDAKLKGVGALLSTAQAAEKRAVEGDRSGTCQLGSLSLSSSQCIKILKKFQEIIPRSWAATMEMLTKMHPIYETGSAAPVFIKVKVKEALGFDGATFSDPLLKMGSLSFAAVASHMPPRSDPEGLFRYIQMSSAFGEKGTSYNTKFWDSSQDCRWDRDCVLTTSALDSCEANDICTPKPLSGYIGAGFPGRLYELRKSNDEPVTSDELQAPPLWPLGPGKSGSPSGFDDLKKDLVKSKTFQMFKDGLVVDIAAIKEDKILVPSRTSNAWQQYLPRRFRDGLVDYIEFSIWNLHPRLENCEGKEPGTPGIDCGGPMHTINLAPQAAGAPFYASMPYFDNRLLVANKEADKRVRRLQGYHPATRVDITRFADTGFGKYNTTLWVEPESGLPFYAQLAQQVNVRLGFANSFLHPQIMDQLVPVFWASETVNATSLRQMESLYDMQDGPLALSSLILFFAFGGIWLLCTFLCCCVPGTYYNEREHRKKAMLN